MSKPLNSNNDFRRQYINHLVTERCSTVDISSDEASTRVHSLLTKLVDKGLSYLEQRVVDGYCSGLSKVDISNEGSLQRLMNGYIYIEYLLMQTYRNRMEEGISDTNRNQTHQDHPHDRTHKYIHQEILTQIRPEILENVSLDSSAIMDKMIEDKLMTEDERQSIIQEKTPRRRKEEFLLLMKGRLSHKTLVITSIKSLYEDTMRFVEEGAKSYLFWIGFCRPILVVTHPETVKIILKTAEPKAKGGGGYDFLLDWLGDGLLVSGGKKWERNRRLLTPAFHFDILHPYVKIYNQSVEPFMRNLERACKGGNSVDVFGPAGLATLDTMLQCTLSYTDDIQQKGKSHPYVKAVNRMANLLIQRSLTLPYYIDFIYNLSSSGRENAKLCNFVHDFSEKIIKARKQALESDPDLLKKRHFDFLDILLSARDENGQGLTDKEIRDEVDTFMFEGHDTTTSAISWCLYCLARYPEEQQKVLKEVQKVIGEKKEVEWDDLAKLQYLPMFIRETMRIYPPVPVVSRQLSQAMVIDGVEVPKGVIVDINFYQMHRNPHVWPDCMEFNPERFHPDTSAGRDPYCFVPFSAGPRNCIGQNFAVNEIKVMVCQIVRRFQIDLDPTQPANPYPEVVLRSENGLFLKFTLRENI